MGKSLRETLKTAWVPVLIIGIILFSVLMKFTPQFSGFGAYLLKFGMGFGMIWAVDKFILTTKTINEAINEKNIAYALVLVAYALVCLAASIGS